MLKYVTLASILSNSPINPFDNREAQVYKDDPEILAMQNLRYAYEQKSIKDFYKVVNDPVSKLKEDDFMKDFIEDLQKAISLEKILSVIIPYRKITLKYLSSVLMIDTTVVEKCLFELIANGKLRGKIDDIEGYFENDNANTNVQDSKKFEALTDWIRTMKSI